MTIWLILRALVSSRYAASLQVEHIAFLTCTVTSLFTSRLAGPGCVCSDGVSRGFDLTVLREESGNQSFEEIRAHALEGLALPNKSLSSKYFYDDIGSGM